MIKGSYLNKFSQSISIGEAHDNWVACAPKSQTWKVYETKEKQKLVRFTCRHTHLEKQVKFVAQNYKPKQKKDKEEWKELKYLFSGVTKIHYVTFFELSKDGTEFGVAEIGYIVRWDDGTVGTIPMNTNELKSGQLQLVYDNQDLELPNFEEGPELMALALTEGLALAYDGK